MAKLTPIEIVALKIAINPSMRQSTWSRSAYVSWRLINELRAELERHGVDWKLQKKISELPKATAEKQA